VVYNHCFSSWEATMVGYTLLYTLGGYPGGIYTLLYTLRGSREPPCASQTVKRG